MNVEKFIEFAKQVGKLKELKRSGWYENADIEKPYVESVADHSYRSALLAVVLADDAGLNSGKVAKMMLLHDLEESITGDIAKPIKDKEDPEKVYARELNAFKKVISYLPEDLQKEYLGLWEEYQEGKTPEAKLARSVDRIDMAIQAQEYFVKYPDKEILKKFSDENDLDKRSPETEEICKKLMEWGKS
jgi:putative hydrolases of HD superfamily